MRKRSEIEKRAAPAVQLNVIHLLAELNVAVSKPEELLDAVSRMASLGFEKSYREAIVLMFQSYLSKLSSVGSAESRTEALRAINCVWIIAIVCCHYAQTWA
ncbi:Phosphatidylinositol 3- and 4-kinase family, ALPHA isoform 1 [Olea europaea subsp. europaea]|uniref:Phosphatidylinositol 3- and 4-kinase family, ALPHA isoform 1 n=1 Tax=Olea europaea subsp. europaea TaxID=158383 RepID=A0A8S0QF78_OLEEU|nr:Phosphatidylinositol 3- and 4-kinase family, ALPHA isoform 1 [Olea europaea subsp. europaea]